MRVSALLLPVKDLLRMLLAKIHPKHRQAVGPTRAVLNKVFMSNMRSQALSKEWQ